MYRVATEHAPSGAILATSLFDHDGRPLALAGTPLSGGVLRGAAAHGYRVLLITDGALPPPDFLSPAIHAELHAATRRAVRFLENVWHADPPPRAAGHDIDAALRGAVREMVDAAGASPGFPRSGAVRSGPMQWFDDAIDAAAVAVALGIDFGLDQARLLRLAQGMILRDVGMRMLPPELHNAETLTDAQRRQVRQHPQRAYDILRALEWGEETSRLIVLQHHERHDGSGYPHGLSGLHSVQRSRSQHLDASLTLLVSDVAAVADVFSALVVHRPHRPPHPSAKVLQILRDMAGTQLNSGIVEALVERWDPPQEWLRTNAA